LYPTASMDEILGSIKDPGKLVVVEESPEFPGELLWQNPDAQSFLARYRDWISRYMCTNELFMAREFVKQLDSDGYDVRFADNTQTILDSFSRYEQPLDVQNFTCPTFSEKPGALYPFQTFTLNRALERSTLDRAGDRLMFVGFCTGSGKSLIACAGAQELINRDQVDVVLIFSLMCMKHNLAYSAKASLDKTTELEWCISEGPKIQRRDMYKAERQVYVLNYEKLWADYDLLRKLTEGKRVLLVLDEAQKLLTAETDPRRYTKTRKHFNRLIAGCEPTVWPMSASVVGASPLRYRDVFNLAGSPQTNPLGNVTEFVGRYALEANTYQINKYTSTTYYTWNIGRLHEVRHRVAAMTQSARKTDPGVREYFKGNQVEIVPIQMSSMTRVLYDTIVRDAEDAAKDGDPLVGYYRLLRYVCNTPRALLASQDAKAAYYASLYPKAITDAHNAKLDYFLSQLEMIADAQEKVIAFTQWTNLSLLLLAPQIKERGIEHVLHYGVGQKDAESRAAQHIFKTDPSVTLFFSSDAGAHGLNLPEAKYNISYECPYSYDLLMQRSERNNRADSQFDTTTYVYVTEGTVEERVYQVNEERRLLAQATLGTTETLNYGSVRATRSEEANLRFLLFGKE
jgi:hypothetical protein